MNKHCPFCGSHNAGIDTFNYANGKPCKFRVQCLECHVATHWRDTEEQAWESWNNRVEGRQKPVNAITAAGRLLPDRNRIFAGEEYPDRTEAG